MQPAHAPSASTTLPAQAALDLTSSTASLVSGATRDVSISVGGTINGRGVLQGGTTTVIHPAQLLTPAQFLAASQVLNSGAQHLLVDGAGAATGGYAMLNPTQVQALSALNVPSGVTPAAINFNNSAPLVVSGAANIAGTTVLAQMTSGQTAVMNAGVLNIGAGGLLTGAIPAGLPFLFGLFSSNNVVLNVQHAVTNSGVISSPGNLTINAGGAIVNQTAQASILAQNINLMSSIGSVINNGTVSALNGNINIAAAGAQSIVVNNAGTIQALLGQINVRDALFSAKSNLSLAGGDWIARELNLNSGQGDVSVDVGRLTGITNVYAGTAHITAASPDLVLGQMQLSGDPSFFNTTGDVSITSSLLFAGQPLAIVAHGDINFGSGVSVSSSGTAGGSIFMLAGANFSSNTTQQGSNDTTSTLTILGAVPGGGQITGGLTTLNSSGTAGSGGNITMAAYSGIYPNAGKINLPSLTSIQSGGSAGFSNGNVQIIGGATSSPGSSAVTLGSTPATVNTSGGNAGTGNITIAAATPVQSGTITVNPGGSISGGSFSVGAYSPMGISVGALTANGAAIELDAGSGGSGNIAVTGNITNNATSGNGGSVTINNNSSSTFTLGAATANGVSGNVSSTSINGTGGTVSINNLGTGGLKLTALTNLAFEPSTAGAGGNLSLNAGSGTLTLPTGTLTTAAVGGLPAGFKGGALSLIGKALSISPAGNLALVASGTGSQNGGDVTLQLSGTSALTVGSGSGQVAVTTQPGTSGGAGGKVIISNGGDLRIAPASVLAAPPTGSSGQGPNLTFTAGTSGPGNLLATGSLLADGVTTGTGGTVTLTSNSSTIFRIDSSAVTNGVQGVVSANGAGAGGQRGGTIIVKNLGSGGVAVNTAANVSAAGSSAGGQGGNLTLDAGTGPLQIGGGVLSADAVGPSSFDAGNIALNGSTITRTGTGNLTLSANGAGGGNGGNVQLTTATGSFTIDRSASGLIISATGGTGGATPSATGNGGSVTVSSTAGNITVQDPTAFVLGPLGQNGAGSSVTLKAGTTGAGTLFVNGSLSANGAGTGTAGSIDLEENSNVAMQIGAGATNGVNGKLTAVPGSTASAQPGSITVINRGTGGIVVTDNTNISAPASSAGGDAGILAINANNGPLTIASGSGPALAQNGVGGGAGGKVLLTGSTLTATGGAALAVQVNGSGSAAGGLVQLNLSGTNALNIGTASGAVNFSATGGSAGSSGGDGGTVIVTNGANITANPASVVVKPLGNFGAGGHITLSTSFGNLLVTGALDASGSPVNGGDGGSITLQSNSASPFLVSGATVNGVQG